MNAHAKISPTTLSLSQLKHGHQYPGASLNARSTGREQDLDALIASIKSEGILQSLLVCPGPSGDKAFYVIAGNRRLAALNKMKWDGDVPVMVRDGVTPGSALAMSLAENVTQCPLHPVDRYETFAQLILAGKTEADIAASYAISERVVKQSLALGRLAPKILMAWRKGDLDADGAKVFTLATDHKAQEAAFDKLKKNGRLSAWSIREALVGDQSETKRLLTFVGREAYEKAGGRLHEDLFARHPGDPQPKEDDDSWGDPEDDDGQFLVSDFALLVRVASEKIKAKCDALVKEGWAWAADKDDLPEGAIWNWRKLDKASSKASAKDKARSGCAVQIDYQGKFAIEYGLIKPGKVQLSEDAAISSEPDAAAAIKKTTKGQSKISNALDARLEEQLTAATKDALKAQGTGNTLAHLLANVVSSQIQPGLPTRSPHHVQNAMAKIRELLPAKDFNAALAKRFDVKGYFSSAPKPIVIRAISEMGHTEQAKKLGAGTKAAAWKWAIANHKGTGWLPPELRTVHYKGPGGKKGGK